jgi:hypothetical protein
MDPLKPEGHQARRPLKEGPESTLPVKALKRLSFHRNARVQQRHVLGLESRSGKRFFSKTTRLRNGWARGCRVPEKPSRIPSGDPCYRNTCGQPNSTDWNHWKPLLFNEWCVHNTQLYSLAYLVVLRKHFGPNRKS